MSERQHLYRKHHEFPRQMFTFGITPYTIGKTPYTFLDRQLEKSLSRKCTFRCSKSTTCITFLSILSERHAFPLFRDRKSTTCITFLNDFQKEHVFKNIVFLRKCLKVLDRWTISEPKMTTCITFLKGSDVEFDSEINKTPESQRLPKDGIICKS